MEWNQMMNSGFPDTGLFRTVADATHSQLLPKNTISCFNTNTKNTLSCFQKTLSAAVSTLSSCPFYSSPFLNSFLPIVDATLSPFHPKQMGCTVRTYLFSRKPCYEEGGQADIKLFCFSSLWPSGLRWPGLTSLAWLGGFTSGRKLAARPTIIHRYNPLTLYPSHASLLPPSKPYYLSWICKCLALSLLDLWKRGVYGWHVDMSAIRRNLIHTVIKSDSWVEHI